MRKILYTAGIIVAIVIILFVIIIFYNNGKKGKDDDVEREKLVSLLNENKGILDFLSEKIFTKDEVIFISIKKGKIRYKVNNKNEQVEQDTKEVLLTLFEVLGCQSISLTKIDGVKTLGLYFDTISAKNGTFVQRVTYCLGNNGYYKDEFLSNWYYAPLYYT